MKGKQSLKQIRAKKGDARTEYEEVKQRCNLSLTPTAIANLDAFATQLNISRSEFVERLARGDGDAIALLVAQEINELVQRHEQAKICQQDITRYPTSVEFKLDKLNGFLLDKESLVVIDSWGAVEPDQIAQTQAWLKAEQKLRSLRAFINNKEPV